MEQGITNNQLICAIVRELVSNSNMKDIEIGTSSILTIVLRVLALPDQRYSDLFRHISKSLHINSSESVYSFARLTLSCFTSPQLRVSAIQNHEVIVKNKHDSNDQRENFGGIDSLNIPKSSQNSTEKKPDLNIAHQRTYSQQIAFQNLFASSVIKMLNASKVHFQPATNKELCEQLNLYLASNRYSNFWSKLADMIPAKSPVQLKEYYKQSFLRFMFQENINFEDKALLRDMLHQMPYAKPSQIVNLFLEKTRNRSYFKRNLIMYLVNLRSKQK